jgi:DNA-binding response OmpR family regulator
LDLGLPDLDGLDVCRRIRTWSQVPIIVLSADGSEDRKVGTLVEGADDYMTKPFGMSSRCRAVSWLSFIFPSRGRMVCLICAQ